MEKVQTSKGIGQGLNYVLYIPIRLHCEHSYLYTSGLVPKDEADNTSVLPQRERMLYNIITCVTLYI